VNNNFELCVYLYLLYHEYIPSSYFEYAICCANFKDWSLLFCFIG